MKELIGLIFLSFAIAIGLVIITAFIPNPSITPEPNENCIDCFQPGPDFGIPFVIWYKFYGGFTGQGGRNLESVGILKNVLFYTGLVWILLVIRALIRQRSINQKKSSINTSTETPKSPAG